MLKKRIFVGRWHRLVGCTPPVGLVLGALLCYYVVSLEYFAFKFVFSSLFPFNRNSIGFGVLFSLFRNSILFCLHYVFVVGVLVMLVEISDDIFVMK